MRSHRISRRSFLGTSALVGAGLVLPPPAWPLRLARGAALRPPGSLPDPRRPAGTDSLPQIDHIVVVMMENHSYDNYLGTLGRGDGLSFGPDGTARNANPDGRGNRIRAFHMPSPCQLERAPGQNWDASHLALGTGTDTNDGFVLASGPVAMGYFTVDDIPLYHGLASVFPVCDRFFCSVLAQTYPNRRFLLAGSAGGIISTTTAALTAPEPPNGNVLEVMNTYGVSWKNYYTDLPGTGVLLDTASANREHLVSIDEFFTDAAAGTLPAVSYVDPGFEDGESEENDANVQQGEAFVARVVQAALQGPAWPRTLLIWTYDEHGGYYDHVHPPRAPVPDDVPPGIEGAPHTLPGGYDRYGFRVPAVVVSPYARRNYVSHVTHDLTSILKLIETKWNLPALTWRDANASDLLDTLDLDAEPAFLEPPALPEPGAVANPSSCTPGEPGVIPPPDAVVPDVRPRRRLSRLLG
ncbi:twin-arginine translocation signal domain-containing protein [Candidatus Binatia bacterium]|nr:twin-arginine translocation signal domain-containing protein [Candidatus Binatia bacterium]